MTISGARDACTKQGHHDRCSIAVINISKHPVSVECLSGVCPASVQCLLSVFSTVKERTRTSAVRRAVNKHTGANAREPFGMNKCLNKSL